MLLKYSIGSIALGSFLGFIVQRLLAATLPWLTIVLENGLIYTGLLESRVSFLLFSGSGPVLELAVQSIGFKAFTVLAFTFLPLVMLSEWPLFSLFSFALLSFAITVIIILTRKRYHA